MENQQAQVQANNIDLLGKKEEKNQEDAVMVDLDQSKDNNNTNGGHHTLIEELHRTRSHSSSSSDEEVEEGGERKRRKKKKGLKEKIKEKLSGEKEGGANHDLQDATPQNIEEVNHHEAPLGKVEAAKQDEDKKGFLDKLKEKLPGHHKTEEAAQATVIPDDEHNTATHPEKKGILEKIMEKLPGHHKNDENSDIVGKEKHN